MTASLFVKKSTSILYQLMSIIVLQNCSFRWFEVNDFVGLASEFDFFLVYNVLNIALIHVLLTLANCIANFEISASFLE